MQLRSLEVTPEREGLTGAAAEVMLVYDRGGCNFI